MYALFLTDGIDVARVAVPERGSVTGTFNHDHFLTALITTLQRSQGPRCAGSNFSMIMHLRTGKPWFKLIKRSRELRFCYIPLIVQTSLLVTFC
jgi:hypothetical protein